MSQIWNTAQNTEDKREKIQALSLAKECYSMKMDLLTNATVVDDAIRFVTDKDKAAANAEPKTDTPLIKEKEQLQSREQESDHHTTDAINQVF